MRRVPRLRTDEEAEAFLDQDLSDLDFSQFKAGQLEYERKDARRPCACRSRCSTRSSSRREPGDSLPAAGPRGDREGAGDIGDG